MFYQTQRTICKESNTSLNYKEWMKFELIEYCKENNLSTQGSKIQLKARIEKFLNNDNREQWYLDLKKSRKIKKLNV